jgi:hypothetical protein
VTLREGCFVHEVYPVVLEFCRENRRDWQTRKPPPGPLPGERPPFVQACNRKNEQPVRSRSREIRFIFGVVPMLVNTE